MTSYFNRAGSRGFRWGSLQRVAASCAVAGALAISVLVPPVSSVAQDRELPRMTAEAEAMASRGADLGMSSEAIANAVARLEAGMLPESHLARRLPVDAKMTRSDFMITEIATFSDGSVSRLTYPDFVAMSNAVWEADAEVLAKAGSATGCSYKYTSAAITWTNCQVNGADIYVNLAYRLDATMVRGYSAKLTRVYDNQAFGKLGSLSHVRFGIVDPSAAQYHVIWTAYGNVASFTRTLTAKTAAVGALSVSLY